MENRTNRWGKTFQAALPYLALVAPLSWFIGALVWTAGIGRLPGELYWVSPYEGFIMTLGSPFFVATFIFLGQLVSNRFSKTGVLVTVLGTLGVAALAITAGFRLIVSVNVDYGNDPNTISKAYNADSIWYLPFVVLQLSGFLSFIISGVALLRTNLAPKWAAVLLILSIPAWVTAQFRYHAEIFWPLASGFWLLGIWGLANSVRKNSTNA
jgi:hypothetical protein